MVAAVVCYCLSLRTAPGAGRRVELERGAREREEGQEDRGREAREPLELRAAAVVLPGHT